MCESSNALPLYDYYLMSYLKDIRFLLHLFNQLHRPFSLPLFPFTGLIGRLL